MINLDTVLGVVFGAGGLGGLAGYMKFRDWSKKNRWEGGENTIARLEKENARAVKRADDAEENEQRLRVRLGKQADQIAEYRGMLIQAGLLKVIPDDDPS